MIVSVMVFLVTVSVVATAAAWLAEEGFGRLGLATRWIWLVAMAMGGVLLLAPFLAPNGGPGALGIAPMVELSPLVVPPEITSLDWGWLVTGLAVVWGFASVGMFALLVRTHRGLLRERAAWDVSTVFGRDVYVSVDRGPAVAGVVRPWIVLPKWVLSLPEAQLSLVVVHEEEHVRGGDSLLLAVALFLVVLVPWNPLSWWQLRRLRMAMEMDCDRRVLSREPDRELYGKSLLTVAARASGASLGLATFTERSLSLKRRILAMTARSSRWTPLGAAMLVLLALVIGVQACGVENPVVADAEAEVFAEAGSAASGSKLEPEFTPFTVAPQITNRQVVVDAMVEQYPPLLRDAGIGGTVRVYFFINDMGIVEQVQIDKSSGHAALDDAAVNVANVYRFAPALNGEKAVPVWVAFPITFQVN